MAKSQQVNLELEPPPPPPPEKAVFWLYFPAYSTSAEACQRAIVFLNYDPVTLHKLSYRNTNGTHKWTQMACTPMSSSTVDLITLRLQCLCHRFQFSL